MVDRPRILHQTDVEGVIEAEIDEALEEDLDASVAALAADPDSALGAGLLSTFAQRPGGRLVVTGDSITLANCDAANYLQADSWVTSLCGASGGDLQYAWNAAHGGYTSTQLAALFDAEVLSRAPTLVGILAGTNDSLTGGQPTTTATNIAAMVAATRRAGADIFLCTLPPQGVGALSTPAAPTLTASATGGTLAAGTYSYRVIAKTSTGQTLASDAATVVIASGTTNSIAVSAPWVQGITAVAIYGRTSGSELLMATNTASGQNRTPALRWVDTGAVTPSGALPGSNTTAVAADTTAQTKVAVINDWLRRYALANRIPLVDFHAVLVDPATTLYRTGWTYDGTHPTAHAEHEMGKAAWTALERVVRPSVAGVAVSQADPKNLYSNGLFLSTSSGRPTGWSTYSGSGGNYTHTCAPRTGFLGNAYGTEMGPLPDSRVSASPAITTGFSVGDVLEFAIVFEVAGESGGLQLNLDVKRDGSANLARLQVSQTNLGPAVWSVQVTIPSATTQVWFQSSFSGGTGTAWLGQLKVTNLTTGGALL